MQGQALQVAGEAATGAQSRADPADDLRPLAIVAAEADEALLLGPRRRLADVVEEGAEAERGAAARLVGQRLRQQRRHLRRPLAGEAVEVALDFERVLEHRQRVAEDVEVVVRSLLDPAQALDLGQDDRRQLQLVEQGEAAQRVGAAQQPPQLGQLALARRIGGVSAGGAGEGNRAGLDLQPQLSRQPRRAQQP